MLPLMLSLALACQRLPPGVTRGVQDNPKHVQVDLLRTEPGGDKVYVLARLPDGERGLFLVDTGAGLSAIHGDLAERLGLSPVDNGRQVSGLGGQSPWLEATLPWVEVGGYAVANVEVAVDVPGMPEYAGWMPLDGILGNNVWREAVLAVDYPADRLELFRPDHAPALPSSAAMPFDGQHAVTGLGLVAVGPDGARVRRDVILELDTGAHGLLLGPQTGRGLEAVATEGEEPVLGLGGSELLPVSAFYRHTRRVQVAEVTLGGATFAVDLPATWLQADGRSQGTQGMLGLAGHTVLSQARAVFDYAGARFAMLPSEGPARQLDGHQVLLDLELDRHPRDPDRALLRAKLRLPLEDWDAAAEDLDLWLRHNPGEAEGVALLARVHRIQGQPAQALELLRTLSPQALLDQGELVGLVNALLLAGRSDEAAALALDATRATPGEPEAWVAQSDVLLAQGRPEQAHLALREAARLVENPDAELKRRAHIALAEGDRIAALAHLRRRLLLYPSDGEAMWFYALLVAPAGREAELRTFAADIHAARTRMHADAVPWDFLAAALRLTGAEAQAVDEAFDRGLARDCDPQVRPDARANCEAWYLAMAGRDLERARALVEEALEAQPHRADYLDTLAVIEEERGRPAQAAQAAQRAAELGPDRFYLLWQLERLRALASSALVE